MKAIRQRSCVVCRKKAEKSGLIRFVCGKDGKVLIDKSGKQPGRGAYVHSDFNCVGKAGNTKIWRHVFKNELVDSEQVKLILAEISGHLIK